MIPPRAPRRAQLPVPITLAKILLTEGDTPTHFCEALLRHLEISDRIEVRNFGGVGDLRTALTALAATTEFRTLVESLGIIRDAETDAAAAREAVNAAMAAAHIQPSVRTAVFILPDNQAPGMLETLCMAAVRSHPPLRVESDCVDSFFAALEAGSVPLPDPMRRAKNHAQAFLATRIEPQMFPGLAAYRGHWPWNSPSFGPLKEFLLAM